MVEFVAATIVFLITHALPAARGLRTLFIERIGRRTYLLTYSVISLFAFGWLISTALRAPYVELWPPNQVAALLTLGAMLPGCILFTAALARPNPLSISFVNAKYITTSPGILALTRHPILWAFVIWSTSHIVANGDLVSVVMFGGLAIFAILGMWSLPKRAKRSLTKLEFKRATALSSGRCVTRLRRAASVGFAVEVICGVFLYVLLLVLHEPVIGVAPLSTAL